MNARSTPTGSSPKIASTAAKPQLWIMFDVL